MRIVQLADYGGPYAGSFVPMLRTAAEEARSRGHDVAVVFTPVARGRPWLAQLTEPGIPVSFAASGSRHDLRSAAEAALTADGAPAVLHSHFTAFDLAARAIARRRPATGAIWHIHTRLGETPRLRAANAVKFSVLGRDVDRIVGVAQHVTDTVQRRGGPRDRLLTLSNAVDVERLPVRSPERADAARAALGLLPDRPVLLHFGRDWEGKGGDLFVGAVRILAGRGHSVVALTVGGGARAVDEAAAQGVAGLVRVHEPTQDVARLYAAADVFVTCSRAEGLPYSLLEAIACGTGVVATAIPGQAEVAGGVPGCRVWALEATAVADAVEDLLGRGRQAVLADARGARDWALANADLRPWARRLVDLYEAVAAERCG
jgi:glycosyltransferase involved in cell wall biosynthesis